MSCRDSLALNSFEPFSVICYKQRVISPLEGDKHLHIAGVILFAPLTCGLTVGLAFAETEQEPCWDFLLSDQSQEEQEEQEVAVTSRKTDDTDKDCLLFEFSSEPLLPCYHVQVSVTQG